MHGSSDINRLYSSRPFFLPLRCPLLRIPLEPTSEKMKLYSSFLGLAFVHLSPSLTYHLDGVLWHLLLLIREMKHIDDETEFAWCETGKSAAGL